MDREQLKKLDTGEHGAECYACCDNVYPDQDKVIIGVIDEGTDYNHLLWFHTGCWRRIEDLMLAYYK
jgi:hypothetical protein